MTIASLSRLAMPLCAAFANDFPRSFEPFAVSLLYTSATVATSPPCGDYTPIAGRASCYSGIFVRFVFVICVWEVVIVSIRGGH